MNLTNRMQSLSLSNKEGKLSNTVDNETGSLPSLNEESLISEASISSASSSWLNLIQNKMQTNNQAQVPAMLPQIATLPMINPNEVPQSPPPLMSPLNPALQSFLSSTTNNLTFNCNPSYPIYAVAAAPAPNNIPNNGFAFPQFNNTNNNTIANSNNMCIRSITVKFITMYYNTLHSNPTNLKRFYYLDAEIDRSDCDEFPNKTFEDSFHKLSALKNVLFVDIQNILYQKSINSSILIRVNGTMKFPQNTIKTFEQIFFIYKSKQGFWLIRNDIFWLIDCVANIEEKENVDESNKDHVSDKTNNKDLEAINESLVNKRMINKFYHDSSYQQYDNGLAIFIRPIPNNITHSKLCGILRTNLIKQCENDRHHIDISINYIDVNYHKQFAFVYFGNQETLNLALHMNEIYINGQKSLIQRKRSHNGPRKFFPKKRN